MVQLDAGWSDLGAWEAIWNVLPKDYNGNAHIGDVLVTGSHDTLVHASHRLVTLVGVSNLVVIETADAVLVADKACSQDVKFIVAQLKNSMREEHNIHRKVHRPWGWYDCIDEGGSFKVKRIQVKPNASLSLQKHQHRAEHWVVVKGEAFIINNDQKIILKENESTYISKGNTHQLINQKDSILEIIEVQSGDYVGEDDIERIHDKYKR
jgi:mannose-1-phosphate guanylyltransferase/mannose-6-phosphate isomerase